jgi:hypothetical protein
MFKRLLLLTALVSFSILSIRAQSFRFIADKETSATLGTQNNYESKDLREEMTVSFEGKTFKMDFPDGESYFGKKGHLEILEVVELKRTVTSGKVTELEIALKYFENGFTEYIVYSFKEGWSLNTHMVSLPFRSGGKIMSYYTYIGFE